MFKKIMWTLQRKKNKKIIDQSKTELGKNTEPLCSIRKDNSVAVHDILSDMKVIKNLEVVLPSELNPINKLNKPISERRATVRMKVDSILLNPIDKIVISKSSINGRVSRDELSNISLGGLQLLSKDCSKKIGDIIYFKFKLGIYKFSLKGQISNIVEIAEEGKIKYGIKFIDVPTEQEKAIEEILGSIKLSKVFY